MVSMIHAVKTNIADIIAGQISMAIIDSARAGGGEIILAFKRPITVVFRGSEIIVSAGGVTGKVNVGSIIRLRDSTASGKVIRILVEVKGGIVEAMLIRG